MKKILIVDDLKTLLITIEAILRKEGYFVMACTNSMDAMDRLNMEHFDLMITDAIMPGGANGYSLIASIRASNKHKDLPIIMLTGKRERTDIEKAISVGANDYIIKPVDPDILISKVNNLLETQVKSDFVHAPVNLTSYLQIKNEILSISESEIKFSANYPLNKGELHKLSSDFLKELELVSLNVRVTDCEESLDKDKGFYTMTAQFVGLNDKELSRIRLWIRKKLSGV